MVPSTRAYSTPIRLDFKKISKLASRSPSPADNSPPPPGWSVWDIDQSHEEIVFIKPNTQSLGIFQDAGRNLLAVPLTQIAFNSPSSPPPAPNQYSLEPSFSYSTSSIETLLKLASQGRVHLLPEASLATGGLVQSFLPGEMSIQEWSSLGFTPPTPHRPALDSRGWDKDLASRYICVSYQDLGTVEKSCSSLWKNYVDSSSKGVYFSKLEVSCLAESGITAGMAPGSTVTMSEDFLEGFPYRPTFNNLIVCPSPLTTPRQYSVVSRPPGQYVGFDPSVIPSNLEINIRWKSLKNWEPGVFAKRGRYLPARDLRRTYYVTPHAKPKMVWFHGAPAPSLEKCLLSPEAGATYTLRPSKQEYKDLVRKYGPAAVPRNFNKYKESQIQKKSQLVSRTEDGEWIFVPTNQSPDEALINGFNRLGKKPIPWRVLRQIHLPGEMERDPFGAGLYVYLVSRTELFSSPERMKKMSKIMKSDGWGFILEEVITGEPDLKRGLFAMVTS